MILLLFLLFRCARAPGWGREGCCCKLRARRQTSRSFMDCTKFAGFVIFGLRPKITKQNKSTTIFLFNKCLTNVKQSHLEKVNKQNTNNYKLYIKKY